MKIQIHNSDFKENSVDYSSTTSVGVVLRFTSATKSTLVVSSSTFQGQRTRSGWSGCGLIDNFSVNFYFTYSPY